MRKNVVEMATLAALLLGAAFSWGQPPATPAPVAPAGPAVPPPTPPAKSKLEEMLQKALQDNPDVRLAAAKLAEAEAELNRARLLVVQKVAAQYQAVEAQKAAVDGAAAELDELRKAAAAGAVSKADLRAVEQKLIDAKAKLASLQAEIPYLLGQQTMAMDEKIRSTLLKEWPRSSEADDAVMMRRVWLDLAGRLPTPAEALAFGPDGKLAVQGPTAERIRAALDKPFTLNAKEMPLSDLIEAVNKTVQETSPGLLIRINTEAVENVNARFDRMPLGAVLELIEDDLPDCRFVVRDYGLVLVPKDRLPPGAPPLHDFWKGVRVEEKPAPAAKIPLGVEGKITAYRADGKVVLNIGGDAGVRVGDEFEAFQPGKAPGTDVEMGPIRVTEVTPKQSVAALVGAFMTIPQEGWRVLRVESNK